MASSGRTVEDQAWVTLATNDTYALGALVLAHSLIHVGTTHKLVVLATPGVSVAMRSHLGNVFDLVQEVNVLDSSDTENLALLSRPDLGITFTKLHCWRLTQFKKCVFMDADTLVLQNCDELFDREELSAAPDVGWPDCFNSGVFVYQPSDVTYATLVQFALTTGSFDGGDQGLLNAYFNDWATKDIAKHLPFVYNMTSSVAYTYLPAYQHFAKDVKVVHFIGPVKPWNHSYNTATGTVEQHPAAFHSPTHLQSWWDIFVRDVKPNLSEELTVETKYVEDDTRQAGLAGYLSQLSLSASETSERKNLEDRARQFAWEQGQIDFMGADSFDNIQKKLDASLAPAEVSETASQAGAAPAVDAEKSATSPECLPQPIKTPKDSVIASVLSDQSSLTQTPTVQSSDTPVLMAPIAVSSSGVGATVSSVLPDASQIADSSSPAISIPPVVPITSSTVPSTPPIPLSIPTTPPVVPATPPIPLPPPTSPPVVSAAPPVVSAAPPTPPINLPPPTTPPVVPATPPTPPIPLPPPTTPPVVPATPPTPPIPLPPPTTPPVVPYVPGTPPVAPAVTSVPSFPVVAATSPVVPSTPPAAAESPAPPVPPRIPSTPPVTSEVPSVSTEAQVASRPKETVPVGAVGAPPPLAATAAAAVAEESAPKAAGGKKSTPSQGKTTPSVPVRKGEKGKPSKK